MIRLGDPEVERIRGWFGEERPGPDAIAAHAATTGHGGWWVDRWPDPRLVLAETAGNVRLAGDPDAVPAAELRPIVSGFVAAPPSFEPVLRTLSERFGRWPRIVYELADDGPGPVDPAGVTVRPLRSDDADAVTDLDPVHGWIGNTWGGPDGLARSGHAWGAFVVDRLASVACTFWRGDRYEDLGVVTRPGMRRRGLSQMCVTALCVDVLARGHRPSWSTSTDNLPSRRVAQKCGFRRVREDVLYVVGIDVPPTLTS